MIYNQTTEIWEINENLLLFFSLNFLNLFWLYKYKRKNNPTFTMKIMLFLHVLICSLK